jgi:phospholipid transport system substrate-binding protein
LKERIDGDNAEVSSSVLIPERAQPVAVNYRMALDGNDWRVYDITIDGISVIANYRTQFNRVLNQGGYDKLVNALKQKQQALSTSIEQ